MKTDFLIDALAQDLAPTPSRPIWPRLMLASLIGAAFAMAIVVFNYGIRADFGGAINAVLAKTALSVMAILVAAPLAYKLARPNTRIQVWLWPAVALVAASFGIAAFALAQTAPDARIAAWLAGGGFPECLKRIPILAAPVAIALVFVVRGLSPTRLTLAGAAIGGLSAAVGAVAYSLFCPIDLSLMSRLGTSPPSCFAPASARCSDGGCCGGDGLALAA